MDNVTGWNELMDGHLIIASFTMFDTALAGWVIAILFLVYQFMLYLKTKNLTLCWTTGLFFASLYGASTFVKAISVQVIFIILVFELAGILFLLIWPNEK